MHTVTFVINFNKIYIPTTENRTFPPIYLPIHIFFSIIFHRSSNYGAATNLKLKGRMRAPKKEKLKTKNQEMENKRRLQGEV